MNIAIIQARMGSTRFPEKTLAPILGIPLLEHIVLRISMAKCIDKIVVATTLDSTDDSLVEWLKTKKIDYYRGSKDDVLNRFFQLLKKFPKTNNIIRITADDPFKDPVIIDNIYDAFIKNDADYASNTINPTFPEGLDIEIFKKTALEKAWKEAKQPSEREHVTPYIWKNTKLFICCSVEQKEDLSYHRWTVDYPEDFEFVKIIFENLFPKNDLFLMNDIIDFLDKHPEIKKRTISDVERNEGYKKTLKKEKQAE